MSSAAAILLAVLAAPGSAQARAIFPPALPASELARQSAGHGAVALQWVETPRANLLTVNGLAFALPARGLPSIRTVVEEAGMSSLGQAVTSLSLAATLSRPGP